MDDSSTVDAEKGAGLDDVAPSQSRADPSVGVAIRVFGDFTAVRGTTSVVARNGVLASLIKAVAVLGPIEAESLAAIVWPQGAPSAQRTRLLNTVGRLRREWGDIVVRDGRDLFAIGPDVTVDVADFRRLTDRASARGVAEDEAADCARRAVGLYAGDLLPFDRYRPWSTAPREDAKARFLRMLDLLAGVDERHGDMLKAVAWVERAIDAQPEEPDRYLWAARLLVAGSRQGRASMMLRRAKAMADAQGIAPSDEYHRILAQATA